MKSDAFHIQRFSTDQAAEWDEVVSASPTGTLQQMRRFLDYHGGRFVDHSLVITESNARSGPIIGVIPIAQSGDRTATSHPGAAHGGLVTRRPMGLSSTLDMFQLIRVHLIEGGFSRLHYRPIPSTFHSLVCQDDLVVLSQLGARISARLPNTVLDTQSTRLGRRKNRRLAEAAGCVTSEADDPTQLHRLLCDTLRRRHNLLPTHTVDDLLNIKQRFPDQLRFYETHRHDTLVAAVATLQLNRATHVQYMCSSEEGFANQALDNAIEFVAESIPAGSKALSFGISSLQDGTKLNAGLARFKETFGGTTHCVDHIEWNLRPEK